MFLTLWVYLLLLVICLISILLLIPNYSGKGGLVNLDLKPDDINKKSFGENMKDIFIEWPFSGGSRTAIGLLSWSVCLLTVWFLISIPVGVLGVGKCSTLWIGRVFD